MVDPVSSNPNAISTLLRAQSTLAAGNANKQATQTFVQKVNNGARPTNVLASAKTTGPKNNLPRGSIVDILA